MLLKEVIEKYQAEALKTHSPGYFNTFLIYFADRPVTRQNVNAWLVDGISDRLEKKYKAETLYTKLCLIKAAYNYCEQCGEFPQEENPFFRFVLPPQLRQALRRKRNAEYKPVEIDHDVIESFLLFYMNATREDKYLQDIALLAYYTGMRLAEIVSLRWESVKTDWIYIKSPKERSPRRVALDESALKVLLSIPQNPKSEYVFFEPDDPSRHVSTKNTSLLIRRYWHRFKKGKSYITCDFTFKTLRAAYIQKSQTNGHSIEAIKKQVGHKSVYITDFAYNGSASTRTIEDFTQNPKNEFIARIASTLRQEISLEDLRCLDLNKFVLKVKEFILSQKIESVSVVPETGLIKEI